MAKIAHAATVSRSRVGENRLRNRPVPFDAAARSEHERLRARIRLRLVYPVKDRRQLSPPVLTSGEVARRFGQHVGPGIRPTPAASGRRARTSNASRTSAPALPRLPRRAFPPIGTPTMAAATAWLRHRGGENSTMSAVMFGSAPPSPIPASRRQNVSSARLETVLPASVIPPNRTMLMSNAGTASRADRRWDPR